MSLIRKTTSPPKEPGSKEIVDEFIASDLSRCVVNMSGVRRHPNSIYISLRQYVRTHPDLGISVKLQNGQITLSKE